MTTSTSTIASLKSIKRDLIILAANRTYVTIVLLLMAKCVTVLALHIFRRRRMSPMCIMYIKRVLGAQVQSTQTEEALRLRCAESGRAMIVG